MIEWAEAHLQRCLVAALFSGLVMLLPAHALQASDGPLVAAASSLRQVWPALMAGYTGDEPRVSFGASGSLARQILQGAPFELFLSADEAMVQRVIDAGAADGVPRLYARGQLQLVVRRDAMAAPDEVAARPAMAALVALAVALDAGQIRRLAIPNPKLAPYGQAALQALQAADARRRLAPHLALGESAAQAYQFVLSGAAEAGIVPRSLVVSEPRESVWSVAIDPSDHAPLLHTLVLTRQAGEPARRLVEYLLSAPAQALLANAGFEPAVAP